MTLIGFPFAATRLDCINRILVANSTAVIATSCIITTHGCRIISVSIVGMANGRAGVLGLVVLADGHTHVISHAVFPDGYAVFLGVGLMADGHRGPSLGSHIAAYGHRIGGVDETRNSQKRCFDIIPLFISDILSVAVLDILRGRGNAPLFIQIIISSILISR